MDKKLVSFGGALAIAVIAFGAWIVNKPTDHVPRTVKSSGETIVLDDTAKTPAKAADKYRIGVLFPALKSTFWRNEAYGVLDEAKKTGLRVVWKSTGDNNDLQIQNTQIDELIAEKVDAILLATVSYSGTRNLIDKAVDAGIPVLTHVNTSDSAKVPVSVVIDTFAIGRSQAQALGRALNGVGEVAVLASSQEVESALWGRYTDGFLDALQQEYPDVKVVATRLGIADRSRAQETAKDLLGAFPSLSAFFTNTDAMAMGVADAITDAKLSESVIVATASISPDSIPYVADGRILLSVNDNPILIGRTAVQTAVRALNGETLPAKIVVPTPEVTRESIESLKLEAEWAPADWTPTK